MLTDIFSNRYRDITLWESFGEPERRLLVQGYRIINEQLFPYWINGKESKRAKQKWTEIHDKLTMELGLLELSPKAYSYQTTFSGQQITNSGLFTMNEVCKKFICSNPDSTISVDTHIKDRISFFEIAFREKEMEISKLNKNLPEAIRKAELDDLLDKGKRQGIRLPGSRVTGVKASNTTQNETFNGLVLELNERFRQAGCKLNYHNGFIQISEDELIQEQIEKEFWSVTKDPLWENVDIDMKEAIDRRDSNGRDPAWYAAKALESTIKIISDKNGWSHGGEKGAHNYIENIGCKRSNHFINEWERDSLKYFFTNIRNPFGHGAGNEKMPKLTSQQTNWAIETCMSWIKNLIKRM